MTNVGHCPLHIEPAAGGTGGHCPAPRVCHGIDIGGEESQAAEGGGLWNSATGTLTATGITFSGNTSPDGPDAYNDGGTMSVNGAMVPPMTGI